MASASLHENTIGIAAITKKGAALGRRLNELLPGSDLYLPEKFAGGENCGAFTFVSPAQHTIKDMFRRYRYLVLIMAVGAAVRMLASELKSKLEDPGVVVVDEAGTFAVSLLSGHVGGANELAHKVAGIVSARPVITTASDASGTMAVDLLGKEFGWKLGCSNDINGLAADIVNGEPVAIYQDAGERHWWHEKKPLPSNICLYSSTASLASSGCRSAIMITDRIMNSGNECASARTVVYRPKSLVVGIGCNRGSNADEIEKAVLSLFSENNLSTDSIRHMATIDLKKDEDGILKFAGKYGLPVRYYSDEELNTVAVPSPPSPAVLRHTGTANVCEAAAILSSGDCELIVPKTGFDRKITLAVARVLFDKHGIADNGKLFLVGLGPGDPQHMTFRAREAIECSDVIVGYNAYVKLIEPYTSGKKVISTGMGKEVQRVKTALDLAGSGKTVALLSSGDTGVYGMAGLVGEILLEQAAPAISLEIVPGIPLLAASASLLGSPISGDFVSISLSDYLVPWEKIALRLQLAAQGDFVIVIYNPKSKKRQNQLTEARRIIMDYRAGTTPVGIVTNAYRPQQKTTITDLEHMLDYDIDMNTTVIIGNSTTLDVDGLMVTPRGYQTKYNLTGEA